MPDPQDLPDPNSEEVAALLGARNQQLLYGFLWRRRQHPPTMVEIRAFLASMVGDDHSQTDRRLGELRRFFRLDEGFEEGGQRYRLVGWATYAAGGRAISQRRRAEVLAPQRCAQCGRTPLEDAIKLVVDHKIPQAWGGTSDVDNLQPLCTDCNAGKRDYFESYEENAEQIRTAVNYDEPQRRIGELLKAFDGQWVRTDLLSLVASAKEYQEDWQRRLRDLRFLDWRIASEKRYNEGARVWTYYKVVQWQPWPKNIRAAISAEEKRRKKLKRGDD